MKQLTQSLKNDVLRPDLVQYEKWSSEFGNDMDEI